MKVKKRKLGINVLEAARQRIAWTFDEFSRIYISFSGGKDSTLMTHLVMDEAIERQRKVGLMFVDWEAQYKLTIDHIKRVYDMYSDHIEWYWIALPLLTTNACSMFEPEWVCWQPEKRDLWVRDLPEWAISDTGHFPFYHHNMTFEDFVPEFGKWYAGDELTACFVGIRTRESLNRWRTIAGHGIKFNHDTPDLNWTNYVGKALYNVYPIYDWKAEDIWTYHAKYPDKPHNQLYDLMHKAGLSLYQMRICEPYGDQQRKGLWLYQIIEPETWGKVVARVAGANTGAIHSGEVSLGDRKIVKPDNVTWEQFAMMLLESMPIPTAEHYKNKIAVWMHWYQVRDWKIKDELPGDTGSQDMPSWRRICKVLLKNDYWCYALSFSANKSSAYKRYLRIMRKRRQEWDILS